MNLRRKSLAELHIERDALQAEMAAHAARLAGRQASAEQFAPALMPQAERLVAIRAQILRRTPARELMARYRLLEKQAGELSARTAAEQRILDAELLDLQLHFANPRRRPLTLKTFLILAAVVAAMLYLPKLIVALLP